MNIEFNFSDSFLTHPKVTEVSGFFEASRCKSNIALYLKGGSMMGLPFGKLSDHHAPLIHLQ